MKESQKKFLLDDLNKKGWFFVKAYVSAKHCDKIAKTLNSSKPNINSNGLKASFLGDTLFNTGVLAESKEAFEIVTSKKIRDLSKNFIQDNPVLKCIRSYQISKFHPIFQWHADNKDPIYSKPDKSKGLVFILYLQDDYEKTFWLASNSFNSSSNKSANANLKQIAQWQKEDKILKFSAKKGDLLVFSQDLFHKHIIKKGRKLKALWWQVVGESAGITERIILSSEFLKCESELLNYLGSGKVSIGYSNPETNIDNLPPLKLLKISFISLLYIPIVIAKSCKRFLKTQYALRSFNAKNLN